MMSREVIESGFVLAFSASPGQTNPVVQLIPFALVLAMDLALFVYFKKKIKLFG